MNDTSVLGHVDVEFSSNSAMGLTTPFEPPLKKRRRLMQMTTSQAETTQEDAASNDANVDGKTVPNRVECGAAEEGTQSKVSDDLWQEFGTMDSRRSELRALYSSYVRLKSLLAADKSNASESSLSNEIQEATFSMIDSGRGYPLVRRIMAEILPKYLLKCPPGTLQLGTRSLIQICDSACGELQKGAPEEIMSVYDATARAIIQTLPDILSASVNSTNSKSVSPMSCASVAREISLYLLSQLKPNSFHSFTSNFVSSFLKSNSSTGPSAENDQVTDTEMHSSGVHSVLSDGSPSHPNHSDSEDKKCLVNEGSGGVKRPRGDEQDRMKPDSNLSIQDLITHALSKSLKQQPEAVLGTCLEALRSGDTQRRKDGLEFLQHVLNDNIHVLPKSPSSTPSGSSKSFQGDGEKENAGSLVVIEKENSSISDPNGVPENVENSNSKKEFSKKDTSTPKIDRELQGTEERKHSSLAFEVLKDRPDSYRWVLTALQQVRRNTVHDIQAQVCPMLQSLLQSLRTLKRFSSEPVDEVFSAETPRYRTWDSRTIISSTPSINRNHSPKNTPPARISPVFSKEREGSVESGRDTLSRPRQGWIPARIPDSQEEGAKERSWGLQKIPSTSPLPPSSLHQQHMMLQQQQKQLQLQIQQLQQKQQQALLLQQQQQQSQKISPNQPKKMNSSSTNSDPTQSKDIPSSKSLESPLVDGPPKLSKSSSVDAQDSSKNIDKDEETKKERDKEAEKEEKGVEDNEKRREISTPPPPSNSIVSNEAEDIFSASRNLKLTGFPEDVNELQLRMELEKYGILESFSISRGKESIVFVSYANLKDALKAKESLHGAVVFGSTISSYFPEGNDSSCEFYAWVGGVVGQEGKEEIMSMFETTSMPGPRSVAVLVSAGAMLLEFSSLEELNFVIRRLRETRRLKGDKKSSPSIRNKVHGSGTEPSSVVVPSTNEHPTLKGSEKSNGNVSLQPSRHLWVGRIDPMVREDEILSAFALYGDLDGWKFMRHSGCCFIDFNNPEAATLAKSRLNNVRFGSQCIHVDFKNNPPHSSSRNSSISPTTLNIGYTPNSLATRLINVSQPLNSFGAKSTSSITNGIRSRSSRPSGREMGDRERVPTNTLWMGLTDGAGNGAVNLSELELKAIFNAATGGLGSVVRIRSTRTSRGPCRFIEFDRVEAASSALRNVIQSSTFDSTVQIEFSNSALSLQQTESPSTKLTLEEIRRRPYDYQKERDYLRYSITSIPPRYSRESVWESDRAENENTSSINTSDSSAPNQKTMPGSEDSEEPTSILGKPPGSDELTPAIGSHGSYRRFPARPNDPTTPKAEGKAFRRTVFEDSNASWKDNAHGGRTGLKYGFRDIASLTGNASSTKALEGKHPRIDTMVETRGTDKISTPSMPEIRSWNPKQEGTSMDVDEKDPTLNEINYSDSNLADKDVNESRENVQTEEAGLPVMDSLDRKEGTGETKEEKGEASDFKRERTHEEEASGRNDILPGHSTHMNTNIVGDRPSHPITTPSISSSSAPGPSFGFTHRPFLDRHHSNAPPNRHPLPSPRTPLTPLPFLKPSSLIGEQTDPSTPSSIQSSSRGPFSSTVPPPSGGGNSISSENQRPSSNVPVFQDGITLATRSSERAHDAPASADTQLRLSSSVPHPPPVSPPRIPDLSSPKHVPSPTTSSLDASMNWDSRGKEKFRPHLKRQNSSNGSHWLCKSGISYCEVNVQRLETPSCSYEGYAREPSGWPSKLDVTKRADYKSLQNSFHAVSPSQREICRLTASPGEENTSGFHKFVEYLKEKDRAGVIKIPPVKGLWARMLYVIPWSKHICELFGIVPDLKHRNTLFALVLPANPSAS